MRLDRHWHQLFGMHGEKALSDPLDCACFALETSDGTILFDAGCGRDLAMPELVFEEAGLPDGPSHVFLTHGHADHSGGAAGIGARYGAVMHAGDMTAGWLEAGDEVSISLPGARGAGVYPQDYRLRSVEIHDRLADGDVRLIGGVRITVVATPGHSADHLSYLVDANGVRTLIAGDAIFANGTIMLQDSWDSCVAGSCRSIRRLAGLTFDRLLPGHGAILMQDGPSALAIAMQRVERFLPPLNFA